MQLRLTNTYPQKHLKTIDSTGRIKIAIYDQKYNKKVTQPLKIIYCLRKNGLTNIPTQKQITNFIARTKKKLFGNASINYKEFSDYCQKFKKVPSDPNEAFLVNFEVDSKNKNNHFVRMVVSSLYLLELAAKNGKMGCIDATYKLFYQVHPNYVNGASILKDNNFSSVIQDEILNFLFENEQPTTLTNINDNERTDEIQSICETIVPSVQEENSDLEENFDSNLI
ncbi:unnamed protein product [Brachionus calyciflorus]|uniref:Uncharacterized protein n=1 Tax=Brachionus calyciflorus TaxID=104777 RepID=A0A814F1G4_9BILA|nr:unnamed protein product [Brachionus calyciflorus]